METRKILTIRGSSYSGAVRLDVTLMKTNDLQSLVGFLATLNTVDSVSWDDKFSHPSAGGPTLSVETSWLFSDKDAAKAAHAEAEAKAKAEREAKAEA